MDRRNRCGDDDRKYRHREPRSGVAIQYRTMDCRVGFASSQ
jgi:hypothetical protein